jgi:uncharacterized membrane protein
MIKEAIVLALIDLIWLTIIQKTYAQIVETIQGGTPMQTRMIYALPVYLALGYILTQLKGVRQAFFVGMSVYAVYDFTVLALFQKYTLPLALADTLWGGILMSSAFYTLNLIKYKYK